MGTVFARSEKWRRAAPHWTRDTWGNCLSLISDFSGTPANAYGSYVRSYYLQH